MAVAAIVPLLLARRQWATLLALCAIVAVGFGAHAYVYGHALRDKAAEYAPLRSESGAPQLTDAHAADVRLCEKRIKDVGGRELSVDERVHACGSHVVLTDTDARIRLLLHAYQSTRSRLLGSGLGTYGFFEASRPFYPVGQYRYPHNLVAEVFHASGLVGVGLLGITLGIGVSIAVRAFMASDRPIAVVIAIPLFAVLVSLVGGDIYDARLLWLMPVVMAGLVRDEAGGT